MFFRLLNTGEVLCYIELSSMCSVRILINYATAAIAFDRLRAVRKPFEYRKNTSKKFSLTVIGFCWIISLAIGFLTVAKKNEGIECIPRNKFHRTDVLLKAVVGKLLPFAIIISCYGLIALSLFRVRSFISSISIMEQIFDNFF